MRLRARFAQLWPVAGAGRPEPGPGQETAVAELTGLFQAAAGRLGLSEREAEAIALAWFDVSHWVNLMITALGYREFRDAARLLPEIGEAAARLGDRVPRAHWLVGLAHVLDDEPIVVIDHATGRGFRLTMSGIGDNFQLHTLLADRLIGDPARGLLAGEPPAPAWVAAASTAPPQPPLHDPIQRRFRLFDGTGTYIYPDGLEGVTMALELAHPDPRYSRVHLIEPAPLGYLHLAADVQAPHRPGPVLRRSRDKHQLFEVLKWQARQLVQLDTVERDTVYDALAFAPPGSYVKDRPAPLPPAWFDVVVLVETASPEAARQVRASAPYQALVQAVSGQARRVHHVAARNVRRVGDVDKSRPGLFLFNYFAGDDPGLAVELWDYLAGWYEAETGLDNSTLLMPLDGEKSDYVVINHARWDHSLPVFMARQLPKKTFRSYLLANLAAHHLAAMPVLYRLA